MVCVCVCVHRGATSVVYRCTHRDTKQQWAVKIITKRVSHNHCPIQLTVFTRGVFNSSPVELAGPLERPILDRSAVGQLPSLSSRTKWKWQRLPAGDTQCIARHFVLLDKDESCLTADLSNIGRPNGPAYSTDELLNTPQLVMHCFWWPVLVATLRSMFVRYPLLVVSTVLGTPRVGLWICGSVRPSHKMSLSTSNKDLHCHIAFLP